jgi:hypothetical protein
MQQVNYNYLISGIKVLNLADQLRLLEEIATLIRKKTSKNKKTRSILELQGKGKEIWQGLNVQKYIDEERAWNG